MVGRRRAGVVAVLACASLVTGCGASDSGRTAFIAAADRACADGNAALAPLQRRIQRAQRGTDPKTVFPALAVLTRRAASASQPYLDRLDALAVPDADRDKLKGWIADQRRQQALLLRLAQAFTAADEAAISRLSQQVDALGAANNAFAARYGMTACARPAG